MVEFSLHTLSMDEQSRFNLLKAVNEASIDAGRPINATELLKVYAATTGSTISESQATRMVRELLSLGDVKAEVFKDSGGTERVQRIEITGDGHKFIYEVQNRHRPFLTKNKKWIIGTIITVFLGIVTIAYKGPAISHWMGFKGDWHAGRDINVQINQGGGESVISLGPQQESLLRAIHRCQVQFGLNKLVILRTGEVVFGSPGPKDAGLNLATEVLEKGKPEVVAREFEILMEGMPAEYLQRIPEARYDNPFVVTVTKAGVDYLNQRK